MTAHDSSLSSKAFGTHADARLIVAYESHQDALRFLSSSLGQGNGIALLQGPTGSGKSTIVNEQRDWSRRDSSVALIEGTRLTPRRLLDEILEQFGIKVISVQDDQSLQRLNNFLTQETRRGFPPVLIIDNADRATESALRLLDWLSALEAGNKFALRIVLTGREQLAGLLMHDSLHSLRRRNPATYSLNPLSAQETMIYLRTRLIAAGGQRPERMFSLSVCDRLREVSRGWPGALNKHAMEVVDRLAEKKPKKPKPRIVVTHDGKTVSEHELNVQKYVIGRTDLADIMIEDTFVSKTHAMLQVYRNAIVLLDLNSTNGTTVNSKPIHKTILRNNDIITMGRYRLKLEDAPAISPEIDAKIEANDTVTMQTIQDLRRVRAQRTIKALKKQ